jgi:hypothetical protein
MSVLEATVEIIKASLQPGGAMNSSNAWYFTDPEQTKKLAACIEVVYEKLRSLEQKK